MRQSDFIGCIVFRRMTTMSESQTRASRPRSAVANSDSRLHTLATYGAFLLIAGIVFGTLPFRPF